MSWKLTIAEHKERFGAQSGEYPEDWDIVATRIKALAGWKCERCGSPMRQEWPKRHFKGKIVCKFCYGILKERAKQEKAGIGA